MSYQNYTITTPLIDVNDSDLQLPISYTRVITPKKGYVVAAADFTHGDLSLRGIDSINFSDTTTPYAFDNQVQVFYVIPPYVVANGVVPSIVNLQGAGTYFLSAEIIGNAVKSGITWSGIVSVRNNNLDVVTITTNGSEDANFIAGSGYTAKAITVNVEPGKFSELFRVKFVAETTSGGNVLPNGQTSTAGQCFYKGFIGFEILTKDIEQYRVQRENVVFDGANIIEFELVAYANLQSGVDFFSFEKFAQEERLIAFPGVTGGAVYLAPNTNANATFVGPGGPTI